MTKVGEPRTDDSLHSLYNKTADEYGPRVPHEVRHIAARRALYSLGLQDMAYTLMPFDQATALVEVHREAQRWRALASRLYEALNELDGFCTVEGQYDPASKLERDVKGALAVAKERGL